MGNKNQFKIFVVDDDTFYLNLLKNLLKQLDQEDITTFTNGVDCLNKLHESPQIIFLDHNMDVLTGYQVLNKIKRYNPNIHVVMVSAQEDISIAVNAMKYGAFDYIQKSDDDNSKIADVLIRIAKAKQLSKHKKPSLFNKIQKFL